MMLILAREEPWYAKICCRNREAAKGDYPTGFIGKGREVVRCSTKLLVRARVNVIGATWIRGHPCPQIHIIPVHQTTREGSLPRFASSCALPEYIILRGSIS